jgi:hypothetical protein
MARTTLRFPLFLLLLVIALLGVGPALALSYAKIKTLSSGPLNIPPGTTWGLDISWVDASTHRYYLADRTNAAIDIVDTSNDTLVNHHLGGFVGATGNNDTSGPNGVLVLDHPHQLWAGDGNSTVKVFDLNSSGDNATGTCQPCSITVPGGSHRSDELTYDARDNLIVIANDADSPPFLTFISVDSRKVVGQVQFTKATDGIEQPVYDPQTHKIFQAVPQTDANPGGEIDVIEPKAQKITQVYPLDGCTPHGLTLGPNRNLLVGCSGADLAAGSSLISIVLNARNGHVIKTITGIGGSDEVWYNPGDNHYYTGSNRWTSNGQVGGTAQPVLGVIDAATNKVLDKVATSPVSHSVAADPANNHIYVPLQIPPASNHDGGIGVFAAS